MDRDQQIKRLMVTFVGEVEEHVRAMNLDLLTLEKEPAGASRAERYKSLFRAVHSMKGAARSVNVKVMEEACHHLEEILGDAREDVTPLTPERFALLFETTDAIEDAAMRLREQLDLIGSPLALLLPRLEAAVGIGSNSPTPASPTSVRALSLLPPSPPLTASSAPSRSSEVAAGQGPPTGVPGAFSPERSVERLDVGSRATVPTDPSAARSSAMVEGAIESPRTQGFVRVPAEKLDALLTRSGELLVARRQVETWSENLMKPREFVARWKAEWRSVLKPFEKLLARDGDLKRGNSSSRQATSIKADSTLSRRAIEALRQVRDNLNRLEKDLDQFAATMAKEGHQLDRAAVLVDEEVRRVRMLPFADACQGLERTARDVALAGGKWVDLVINGGDVEIDRSVLEGLKDPLCHLVRNAVDHGLETPEERIKGGKPPRGRVTVSAALRGDEVEVIVADDGKGLDSEAIRRQARKRGLAEPTDDHELAQLIFHPGFSTAPIISNISGRGVGLDVVNSRLDELHGTIDVKSEVGRGSRFTLAVPLTLTTLRGLLVSAGGQVFVIAGTNVQKLIRVGPGDFRSVQGREVLALGGPLLPVVSLAHALGLPPLHQGPGVGKRPGVIVAAGERRMAFVVDELLSEQEVIVKSLGTWIRRVREFSGATILSSGRVALVINAGSLIRTALGRASSPALAKTPVGSVPARKKRLLVVDDSITTRTLEKSILEAAGYEILTAVDGEAGWKLLQEQGADLLLSDVQMPRMDGFELTEAVRASKRFADLPVVLFTSLANERDRNRGIAVGADAYIVKGAFDQKDLIETIAQLL